ncbi:MAG: hypothetical protein V4670_04005 [Bacteroidota bacterium]
MKAYLIFFFSISLFAQKAQKSLPMILQQADSLQITSHSSLSLVYFDGTPSPTILVDGVPNYKIIKEIKTLSKTSVKELGALFLFHKNLKGGKDTKCFEPHHSILIFKNGNCSYIDICFHCQNYKISKDLNVARDFLNRDEDWKKLEIFFRSKNIHYEMP